MFTNIIIHSDPLHTPGPLRALGTPVRLQMLVYNGKRKARRHEQPLSQMRKLRLISGGDGTEGCGEQSSPRHSHPER